MRVVANVPRAHFTGGVELSVFYTLRGLSERGHEVHLLYGEGGDLVARYKDFCKSVTHIEPWDFFFPAGRLAGLREHARVLPAAAKAARRRPDVYYMNRSFAAVWALDAAMVAPAPVVCHWRGPMTPPARYLPRLANRVSRFLANSDFTRQGWLKVGIDPAKTAVVYPGIDPDKHPFGGQPEREAARRIEQLGFGCSKVLFQRDQELDALGRGHDPPAAPVRGIGSSLDQAFPLGVVE